MGSSVDERIRELAAAQQGLVARRQLRRLGLDGGAIGRRVRRGALVVLSKRVLSVGGTPSTARGRMMAGVLDGGDGAALSHGSASSLWRVPGFRLEPVEVIGSRVIVSHGTHDLAIVHQPRNLLDRHCVEVDGIRVTTPTRTIFDLAGSPWMHAKRLERSLDTLWARGKVSHGSLTRMLHDLARRGRPGITLMRTLLSVRGPDYLPPGSNAEACFQQLVRSWGYGDFERQADVGDEERWIGRVDFVDSSRRLVVEVDPSLHHSSITDRRHDHERHSALEQAGFGFVSVTEDDLFFSPGVLRARLSAIVR